MVFTVPRSTVSAICPIDHVDYLITDADPARSTILPKLAQQGITVLHVQ